MSFENILNVIANNTREVLPDLEEHNFVAEDSLRRLGANSIDRSEIIMMTLDALSLKVPLLEMASAENMGEIAAILHEKSQAN